MTTESRRYLCSAIASVVAAATMSSHARLAASPGQPPAAETVAADISPEALAQIEALIREKDFRSDTEQKIDSQLIYELRMEFGQSIATGVSALETDLPYAADGHVVVDVRARLTGTLLTSLAALGVEVLSSDPDNGMLRVHINIDQVEALAALPDVTFVQPKQEALIHQSANVLFTQTGQGSRSSEGDITHLAYAARAAFGANGSGIKIGVLSDGVTNLAASQASGDLGPVTVLAGQAGSGDEGTAMLEIIHDVAPGAQLYFATAFTSITSFADNIRALRTAGCDIIVDDVSYFVETPFQDGQAAGVISNTNGGAVIQAVNDVTVAGALYFSSAGNSGNLSAGTSGTWEGNFVDGGASSAPLTVGRLHNFGGQNFDVLSTLAGSSAPTNLYWSDPLGGSANDYDLFRLNSTGTMVRASSTNIQNGSQDPYEQVSTLAATAGDRIVIVKKNAAASRFLHLGTNRGVLTIATSGETHGHAAAAAAFDVAAAPAVGPFPQPFSASSAIETFSSDGPRRVFFQANSTPYTPGNFSSTGGVLRQKPDITAADGVSVTGVGGFPSPFFGTSAAAPHAAAIAGLLKSANPALTPAQIRTLLTASAIDVGAAGADRDSGAGIIMADALMRAAGVPGTALLEVTTVQAFDNPGNGNGAPEAGEGARLTITMTNYGGATATGVSATMTSSTPGITVTQPATSAYPNVAVRALTTNTSPFRFTIASDYPCNQPATFTLTVSSSGGPSPKAFTFQVPVGPPAFSITTTLDTTAPPSSPGVTTTTGTQSRRLNRDGIVSSCGSTKTVPPLATGTAARRFDAYSVNTCSSSAPSCVTVTLQSANGINLFSAAYAPTFNPASVQQNYKADAGASGSVRKYAFDLAGGAQTFAVDVHEVNQNGGVGTSYTLNVAGACLGSCAPPNRVPIAIARDVTVVADGTGTANASINNGSSDPDGDPLTITQLPAGPYPIGQTAVVLTVSDPKGATSQATATVTVTGPPVPSISIADASVQEGHSGTVNAQFHVTLSSSSAATVTVTYATANQTATAPADYTAANGIVSFAPGQIDQIVTVLVKGDTIREGNETLLVNLTAPTNGTIARAQAVGTIVDDDVVTINEADVTQAVSTGSARVESLQRVDGGWFFKAVDTDCGAGSSVTCPNAVGITALGLLAGYTRTGSSNLLAAATLAGNNLVTRYNNGSAQTPPPLPFSQDVEFLTELGLKTGNALYTSTAQSWFQVVVARYPNAADRIDAIMSARDGQHLRSLAAWDSASLIRAAKAVGNVAYAQAAAARIRNREPDWKDTTPAHRFDQCPNPAGCGPADNRLAFDHTILAEGSLLWALSDLPGFDAQISEYRNFLTAQQDLSGSWDVGDTQITAYVVLGLAAVGGAGADQAIQSAVAFFLANQLPSHGWPSYIATSGSGAEYTEVDAEVVRAMFTLYNTPAGSNVFVAPAQLSTMTFSTVSASGFTSVVAADDSPTTTVAPGFEVVPGLNYDVITTATVSGDAVACFSVPWITDAATFANVRLLHAEGGVLVDRTILAPGPSAPNFTTRQICAGVSSLSRFAVALRDTTPPTLLVTLSPSVLRPHNHRMVTVRATIDVRDASDQAPTVKLVSITSSEPDNGPGDGNTTGDVQDAAIGTDDRTFLLRAEQSGRGPGRVYTIVYRATNRFGNTRDVTTQVVVPR